MKKYSLVLILCVLAGCQSTTAPIEPVFNSEVIEISPEQLSKYWVVDTSKIKMLKRRPTWLPKGKGEWTVLTVIDSNGNEVKRTLISASPEGYMTQAKVEQMPKSVFMPSASNQKRVPVKFYSTAKIAPRSEL